MNRITNMRKLCKKGNSVRIGTYVKMFFTLHKLLTFQNLVFVKEMLCTK